MSITPRTVQSLDELHAIEVELLLEIKRVCDKHGIRWFLHAGTLLGALRHEGPIPWDDDADIGMLPQDFERFRRIAPLELGSRFAFVDPADHEDFFDFICRVTDLEHVYEASFDGAERFNGRLDHPDVDIFVFEPALQGAADALQSLRLTVNYACALGHRPHLDRSGFSGVSKLASYVLPALGRRKPLSAHIAERDAIAKCAGPCSEWVRIANDQPLNWDKRYRRAWLEPGREASFAGERFPVPQGAEQVLEALYGPAWTDLPPADKRHPTHSYLE